jgi:MFS family permease
MTALSGLARSFGMLLFLRMGVGIGEAAGTPPAHSLISDYFGPERRARALSVHAMGLYAGIMFGYLIAGWIGQYFGWRATFLIVGLPGLLVALLVGRTVDEHCPAGGRRLGLGDGLPRRTPRGAAGALCGGVLADRLGAGDQRWYAWVAAIAAFAALPFGAAFLLIEAELVALLCFAPHIFAIGVYTGPLYAMNQGLARPRMRAMAVAVHLFVVSVVGGDIGPFLVGRLSDGLAAEWGDASIRHALLIVLGVGTLGAGIFYLFTSRTLRADLAEASA